MIVKAVSRPELTSGSLRCWIKFSMTTIIGQCNKCIWYNNRKIRFKWEISFLTKLKFKKKQVVLFQNYLLQTLKQKTYKQTIYILLFLTHEVFQNLPLLFKLTAKRVINKWRVISSAFRCAKVLFWFLKLNKLSTYKDV